MVEMLTHFVISVGDKDCWVYQPTLARVDQDDYHMPGLIKKPVLRVPSYLQRTALEEGHVHPPTPYVVETTKLFVLFPEIP
jgi:hypothetical protein